MCLMPEIEPVKTEILEKTTSLYKEIEGLLEQMTPAQLTEAQVAGWWSVREILINISYWQEELVGWLEQEQKGQVVELPDLSETGINTANGVAVEARKDWELERVLDHSRQMNTDALEAISGLTEEDIITTGRYSWMGKYSLAPLARACMDHHYDEHLDQIRSALDWNG